jgi:DNA repair protein RadC
MSTEPTKLTLTACESCGHEFYRGGIGASVSCSADVYKLLPALRARHTEVFDVLVLNTKNRIIHHERVAQGGVNTVHIETSSVVRAAIVMRQPSLIVVHNHPSGDPTPSPEDRLLTERIAQSCGLMGLRLLDHIILSSGSYYSFSDAGAL